MISENWTQDKIESRNMILIISTTAIVIFAWIIISWLTGTWPKSLKCSENQSFFDGKCYDNWISCSIDNGSWKKSREWNNYWKCIALNCNSWFELIDNQCLSEVRTRSVVLNWPITTNSNKLWEYPSIKINKPIQWWTIRITIDFQKSYKDGRYDNFIYWWKVDWSPAKPYNYGLNFFLWKWNQWTLSSYAFGYWWFFDAITVDATWKPANSSNLWANGVVPWNQIIWWYNREIPIDNNVIFATKTSEPLNERRIDYQYKKLNILDYFNNNVWSKIYIGWYLSNMNNEPGRKFTEIKEIKIEYIWWSGALSQ